MEPRYLGNAQQDEDRPMDTVESGGRIVTFGNIVVSDIQYLS